MNPRTVAAATSLPFLLLLLLVDDVTAECPSHCDPSNCPKQQCTLKAIDQCGCCQVCVHGEGEQCGRLSVCGANLTCYEDTKLEPFCIRMEPKNCLNAPCSVVFHPKCPDDSSLLILPPPAGECCGKPGKCRCDDSKCEKLVPKCEKTSDLVLIEKGKADVPGECCDQFECRKRDKNCANVHCPTRLLNEDEGVEECPEDSYLPPVHVPEGTCCPVKPRCQCRGSICKPATCPAGKYIRITKKGNGLPGKCCDEFTCETFSYNGKVCIHDGKEYSEGAEWHFSTCNVCKCKRGVAVCSKMTCPQISPQCTWIVIPDGECCPVCFGCQTDSLEKKKKHETWQKDDCTTCTCSEEGSHMCEKHMCMTECDNPKKIKGQCCPVCDEPTILRPPITCPSLEHCTLRCENGLRRDERGCYLCECAPVDRPLEATCLPLNETNCDKQCAHGYLKDNKGCLVCKCAKCPPLHQCYKHCLYGFETNNSGCPVCKCRAAIKSASSENSVQHASQSGNKEKCFSITTSGRTITRDGGEWWSDGCRHCFCENSQEFCSLISCPSRPDTCPEEKWTAKEGECCPACSEGEQKKERKELSQHEHTVCQSPGTGRLFTDGETWQLAPCVSCTCRVGHVLCKAKECPPIACHNPDFMEAEDCCPRCPDEEPKRIGEEGPVYCTDEGGVSHKYGEQWRADDCTSCRCDEKGELDCYRETCDTIQCEGNPLVIKGRCCPVCSDVLSSSAVCAYQSSVYSVGEEWQDGQCSNCSCVAGGQTLCRQMVCPHCIDPVPIQGHCCPLCKDHGWAPYELGNSSMVFPSSPSLANQDSGSFLPLIGLSLLSIGIVGLLVLLMLLYKRSRRGRMISKMGGDMDDAASVRLASTKMIGSTPRLAEWSKEEHEVVGGLAAKHPLQKMKGTSSDGQSDSLLSTSSDFSTTSESAAETTSSVREDTHKPASFPV